MPQNTQARDDKRGTLVLSPIRFFNLHSTVILPGVVWYLFLHLTFFKKHQILSETLYLAFV